MIWSVSGYPSLGSVGWSILNWGQRSTARRQQHCSGPDLIEDEEVLAISLVEEPVRFIKFE